jgi:anionic cell wall polymer biosynthesis LytR-Cps2A-Psr (LCP) family protein
VGVDHVVTLDFAGFRSLVDQVGGVEVAVRAPVRDVRTGFHVDVPGCTELDGAEALALARSRHLEFLGPGGPRPDTRADLGRVDAQRALVMAALADLGDRRDPVALNRLVDWAVAHVTVDAALDRRELARLARAALALDPDDVSGATLPVRLAPGRPDHLVPDDLRAPAAIRAFREGRPLPAAPAVSGPALPPVVTAC